jgi:hypothetical protein
MQHQSLGRSVVPNLVMPQETETLLQSPSKRIAHSRQTEQTQGPSNESQMGSLSML